MRASVLTSVSVLAALVLAASPLPTASSADEVCPDIAYDDQLAVDYPTYKYRCTAPVEFVKDGRELGFTDDYEVDWIRPGINVGPCSTSFLLTDDDGRLYVTQSAHCVGDTGANAFCDGTFDPVGTEVPIEGYGIRARIAYVSGTHMQAAGATAPECSSYDFAILELPSEYRDVTHPAIRHVGGPTGLQDPLELAYRDPMAGYGNSDDRGFVVEFLTGDDHGNAPVWPVVNTFTGYYVGAILDEAFCTDPVGLFCEPYDGIHGYRQYVRYYVPKITGDSGSADLTGDGKAVGVTSVLNFATALMGTMPLYDSLLKIRHETGKHYYLVTWDEWSPDTIET